MGLLEIHLYNGRLVAAPHHWAGQRPLLLDICVNHIEGSLLVISVPAVPECKSLEQCSFPPLQAHLLVTLTSVINSLLQGSV